MKTPVLMVVVLLLSACASNRDVAGDFKSLEQGQISPQSIPAFLDCANGALRDRPFGFSFFFNRQSRRSNGYRVDLMNPNVGVVMSADILDDGHVELFEWNRAGAIPTGEERKAFALCINRFKVAR